MFDIFGLNKLDREVLKVIRASEKDLSGKEVSDLLKSEGHDARFRLSSTAAALSIEELEKRGHITSYRVYPPEGQKGKPVKYFHPKGVEREMITQYRRIPDRISISKKVEGSFFDRLGAVLPRGGRGDRVE